ncbi:hypothetical protein WA158_001253 [Blastocystis sp. Blastoise]
MAEAAKLLVKVAKWGVGIGCAGFLFEQSIYDVDGGQRAVMFDRFKGVLPKVIGEGTHFRIPLIQYPQIYDIRMSPREISTETGTKDLQTTGITLRVLTRPDVNEIYKIHKNIGPDYRDRILPSVGNEILKAVVAQYTAEELLTEREKVSNRIEELLMERCEKYNIHLDDVSITHIAYGAEFTAAIEEKQVALQRAERAKFEVAKAEQEKKAEIIRAEGEAEAAEMISQALDRVGPAVIEVKRIEAARDIAQLLARNPNVTYLPGNNGGNGVNLFLGAR